MRSREKWLGVFLFSFGLLTQSRPVHAETFWAMSSPTPHPLVLGAPPSTGPEQNPNIHIHQPARNMSLPQASIHAPFVVPGAPSLRTLSLSYRPSPTASGLILSSVLFGMALVPFGASTMTASFVDTSSHKFGSAVLGVGLFVWGFGGGTALVDRHLQNSGFARCLSMTRFVDDCTTY